MTSVLNAAAFPGPQWSLSLIQPTSYVSPSPAGTNSVAFLGRRSLVQPGQAAPAQSTNGTTYYAQSGPAPPAPNANPFQAALQTFADVSMAVPLNINTNQKIDTTNHYHIFVGDLAPEVENKELYDAFANFGLVTECKIIKDMHTQKPKGYGFVAYATKEEAELAIQRMNGQLLGSRPIRTGWAVRKPTSSQPKDQRPLNYSEVANASSASNCTVYVGGITKGLCEEALRSAFQEFGEILEVRVFKEKGYSFIRFDTHEGATKAIITMHGKNVAGQPCKCSWGKESSDSTLPTIGNLLATLSKQAVAANQFSYLNVLAAMTNGNGARSDGGPANSCSGSSSASAPPAMSFLPGPPHASPGTPSGANGAPSNAGITAQQRALAYSQPALSDPSYSLSTLNGFLPGLTATDPTNGASHLPYPNELCNGILTSGRLIGINGTGPNSGAQAASAVTLATLLGQNGHSGLLAASQQQELFSATHLGLTGHPHLGPHAPGGPYAGHHPADLMAAPYQHHTHQLAIHTT